MMNFFKSKDLDIAIVESLQIKIVALCNVIGNSNENYLLDPEANKKCIEYALNEILNGVNSLSKKCIELQ